MMLRDGQLLEAESLSELGVYGTFIRQGDDVLLNKQAGHLVRTKVSSHCSVQLFTIHVPVPTCDITPGMHRDTAGCNFQ